MRKIFQRVLLFEVGDGDFIVRHFVRDVLFGVCGCEALQAFGEEGQVNAGEHSRRNDGQHKRKILMNKSYFNIIKSINNEMKIIIMLILFKMTVLLEFERR